MEQWVCDGRTVIRDRGCSLIPKDVETADFEDLSGCRGLLKKIVKEGNGEKPRMYAECSCAYKYCDPEGRVVDCSDDDGPLEVLLGAGQVTQGFDEGLASMKAGEIATFWLDPAFAFRENGLRTKFGGVSPDTPVMLTLELLSFDNPMNAQQKLSKGKELKEAANAKFCSGDVDGALRGYHDALRKVGATFTPTADEAKRLSSEELDILRRDDKVLRSVLFNNIATCWYEKDDNTKCLHFVEKSLLQQPTYAKALFRKALVFEKQCNFDAAIAILRRMEEESIGAASEVTALRSKLEAKNTVQSSVQSDVYKKMFWGASS